MSGSIQNHVQEFVGLILVLFDLSIVVCVKYNLMYKIVIYELHPCARRGAGHALVRERRGRTRVLVACGDALVAVLHTGCSTPGAGGHRGAASSSPAVERSPRVNLTLLVFAKRTGCPITDRSSHALKESTPRLAFGSLWSNGP